MDTTQKISLKIREANKGIDDKTVPLMGLKKVTTSTGKKENNIETFKVTYTPLLQETEIDSITNSKIVTNFTCGSESSPVYINDGSFTECTSIKASGGTLPEGEEKSTAFRPVYIDDESHLFRVAAKRESSNTILSKEELASDGHPAHYYYELNSKIGLISYGNQSPISFNENESQGKGKPISSYSRVHIQSPLPVITFTWGDIDSERYDVLLWTTWKDIIEDTNKKYNNDIANLKISGNRIISENGNENSLLVLYHSPVVQNTLSEMEMTPSIVSPFAPITNEGYYFLKDTSTNEEIIV